MLTVGGAIAKLTRLRASSTSSRAWLDSWLTLAKIYDHGKQWGYARHETTGYDVRYLQSISDPQRVDVRIAVNKIHETVVKLDATLAPERIAFQLEPRNVSARVLKRVGEIALSRHLERCKALQVLRDCSMPRLVLGSSLIRRTLSTQGRPLKVAERPDGKDLAIRNIRPGIAVVSPHEILRDPAANTHRFAEHETIFAHEKPRSTAWVQRNFGVKIDTETTLGSLYEYQRQLRNAAGMGSARHVMDSKIPGVVVYECYFDDPDEKVPWPWVLFCYLNTGGEKQELQPLAFGRNPHWGLPFHMYTYDNEIQSPWGRGVPHVMMDKQDLFNIGVLWFVRLMQAGAGKWRYARGQIKPTEEAEQLSNDVMKPLVYDHIMGAQPPDRVEAPGINANAMKFVETAPQWMRETVNLSEVQFGQSSKRGEAGKALEIKLGEANAPLERLRRDDQLATSELLLGMFYDLTDRRHLRLDEARELIGQDEPDDFVRALVREDTPKAISAVNVHSSMHRPRTPAEIKESQVSLVVDQVKSGEDAEWEMLLAGHPTNTAMKNAFDKQLLEIAAIRRGQEVRVSMGENHRYHRRTIEWSMDQPAWLDLPEDVQAAIQDHDSDHTECEMMRALGAQMTEPGMQGQGSPPAEGAGMMPELPTGTVEPAPVAA